MKIIKPKRTENLKYYQGGCINCGNIRENMQANLYIKTNKGSEISLGVCDECGKLDEYDLEKIKTNLLDSETELLVKQGKPSSLKNNLSALEFKSFRK